MRVFNSRGARMRGGEVFCGCQLGFYVFLVVLLQQIWCMHAISWLSHIVTFGVSLPFDKILQGVTVPEVPVIPDSFHFVFCFSFD
jgi:hypothetical protein